jgi:hypothetical protein
MYKEIIYIKTPDADELQKMKLTDRETCERCGSAAGVYILADIHGEHAGPGVCLKCLGADILTLICGAPGTFRAPTLGEVEEIGLHCVEHDGLDPADARKAITRAHIGVIDNYRGGEYRGRVIVAVWSGGPQFCNVFLYNKHGQLYAEI